MGGDLRRGHLALSSFQDAGSTMTVPTGKGVAEAAGRPRTHAQPCLRQFSSESRMASELFYDERSEKNLQTSLLFCGTRATSQVSSHLSKREREGRAKTEGARAETRIEVR